MGKHVWGNQQNIPETTKEILNNALEKCKLRLQFVMGAGICSVPAEASLRVCTQAQEAQEGRPTQLKS